MGNIFSVVCPAFCDQLVQPFFPYLCGKREYLYNLEEFGEDLQKEMQDLNTMRNHLLRRVSEEVDRGLQVLEGVKRWIAMVEEIEPEANYLLDKSVSEILRLSMYGYCSWNSASTYDYTEDLVRMLIKVENLRLAGAFEVVVDRALLCPERKRPPIQLTVSQAKSLDIAWDFLQDGNVGSLGIYGVVGVGKTIILNQIKNKIIESGDAFGLVIFVVVASQEVKSIQDGIAQNIGIFGNSNWKHRTKKERAAEISTVLKGNRFVLLVDAIRRELDLEEIGVPFPSRENGCKIVFTTSSQEACGSKWADAMVQVTCLSPHESWDLFQNTVGEQTLISHRDIPKLARIVARKCGGLPVALNLIGETMSGKRTVRQWHQAINVLVSSVAEFSDMKDKVHAVLKFSYDSLPDEKIRLCFLYCALFPNDYEIKKEDLVGYWIGEGIISEEDKETAEIEGYNLIGDLVRMCMLMEDESRCCVKMHGMVREMALWLASDFGRGEENFVVQAGEIIQEMPKVRNWRSVKKMSVISTQIETISGSPHCSELTTLFLQENNLKRISGDFFRWMTSLVLLDLSYNRELTELPEEVSSLLSLQFLNLSGTMIKRLPLGLKELKKLIHLDLDYTHELLDISVIASLLNLQVLRLFRSVTMDRSLIEDINLLKSLTELSLTLNEDFLSNVSLKRIQRLSLSGVIIYNGGIPLLTGLSNLRELDLRSCRVWETRFERLEKIPKLKNICKLSLDGCCSLRDLTSLLCFPFLEDLSLARCLDITQLVSKWKAMNLKKKKNDVLFQNLTRLSLHDVPKLEIIHWTPLRFPALKFLRIRLCPELKRLPFNSESAKGNLLQLDIDEQSIKKVIWEDEATQQRFSGFNNRGYES